MKERRLVKGWVMGLVGRNLQRTPERNTSQINIQFFFFQRSFLTRVSKRRGSLRPFWAEDFVDPADEKHPISSKA